MSEWQVCNNKRRVSKNDIPERNQTEHFDNIKSDKDLVSDHTQEVMNRIKREIRIIKDEQLKLQIKIEDEIKIEDSNFSRRCGVINKKISERQKQVDALKDKIKKGSNLGDYLIIEEELLEQTKVELQLLISSRLSRGDIEDKYLDQKLSLRNRYNDLKKEYIKNKYKNILPIVNSCQETSKIQCTDLIGSERENKVKFNI